MEFLVKIQSTIYAQIGIFIILLLAYYFFQRKLPRFRLFSVALLRGVVVIAIFIYLFMNWSSEVNPTLRNASVLGMFVVNLYMLWQVILARMEFPYRDALEACSREPENPKHFYNMVNSGKRFYYMRYFWHALFGGGSLHRILHGIAREQVTYDFQRIFRDQGKEKRIINFQMAMAFLRKQLAEDESYPQEFKEAMEKSIAEFSSHSWIEEHTNKFLVMVLDTPEVLLSPEWASDWEKIIKS